MSIKNCICPPRTNLRYVPALLKIVRYTIICNYPIMMDNKASCASLNQMQLN